MNYTYNSWSKVPGYQGQWRVGVGATVTETNSTTCSVTVGGALEWSAFSGWSNTYLYVSADGYLSDTYVINNENIRSNTYRQANSFNVSRGTTDKTITIRATCYLTSPTTRQITISTTITIPKIPYQKMGAPIMKISSNSAKRGTGSVTVSWSAGALGGSSVKSYVVAYGTTSSPTSTWYSDTGTSKTFTMPAGVSIGTTYYFRAYQKSNAGSSYDSAWSSTVYVKATTNKPTITITSSNPSSKIIPYNSGSGGNASFVISYSNSAGTGSTSIDVTKDWLRNGTTVSKSIIGEEGTTESCTVTVSDGYESSSASITFTINTVPQVTDASFTTTNYSGVLPDENTTALVKAFQLNEITTSKSVNGYYLYLKSSIVSAAGVETAEGVKINQVLEAKNTIHNCSDVSALQTKSTWFQLGVQTTDGLDLSDIKWCEPIYFIPKDMNTFNGPTWGISTEKEDNTKLNENLTITWTNPKVDAGRTNLKSSIIYIKSANITTELDDASWQSIDNGSAISEGENKKTISISSYRGKAVQFKVSITDEYGNVAENTSNDFTVVTLPTMNNATFSSSSVGFQPYNSSPMSDFELTLDVAGHADTNTYTYLYSYFCPSKGTEIPLGQETSSTPSTFEHIVNGEEFKTKLLSEVGLQTSNGYWNSKYTDGYFRVKLVDAFGNQTSFVVTPTVTVDYQAAPSITSATFQVAYNQSDTTYNTNVITIEESEKRVIGGEKAIFSITADDPNGIGAGKESITYQVEYAYSTISTSPTNWSENQPISITSTSNEGSVAFTFPTVNEPTYYKFRCRVRDTTNKNSDYQIINYYVINEPTPSPIAILDTPSPTGTTIDWSLPTDLISYWASDNRACNSSYWSSTPKSIEIETSTDGLVFENLATIYDSKTTTYSTSTPTVNTYVRIKVTYKTGLKTYESSQSYTNSEISAYSSTVIWYVTAPLVSYRKKQLGINNTTPSSDAIIDIKSPDANIKKIKLGSQSEFVYPQDGSSEHRVDLNSFIIDCGTFTQ